MGDERLKIEMIKSAIRNLIKMKDAGLINKEMAEERLNCLLDQLNGLLKKK